MQAGLETGGQEAVQYGARSEDEPEGESKGEPEGESEGEPEGGLFACNAAVVILRFPLLHALSRVRKIYWIVYF